ncbi:RNA polymerase sigma factor [Flavobacterium beibuense]|uniref:RNA polymerase sigma factor, sigma-70 family n=1 Tax=Flavobacterium beibuense TaxID=657326 RepID=A0A444WF63_9FLAO|nr:sigma-70 family RNA polymerase sigma factor [Flavobacterium beibuense]RYJ44445.1 RNA polymerase sigma factor, sigma-70 family [Flavobacterium beibuense]
MIAKNDTITEPVTRKEVLEELYIKAFPAVAGYVGKMGGSLDEAKDIFHDALIVYMEKSYEGVEVANESAYLLGIARHLWSKRFNQLTKVTVGETVLPNNDTEYTEAVSSRLMKLLSTTGKKCMELLSAFYYEKLDMDKLANRFGFSGSRSATAQKYKCLEKVKDTVKSKSLEYEDFME